MKKDPTGYVEAVIMGLVLCCFVKERSPDKVAPRHYVTEVTTIST